MIKMKQTKTKNKIKVKIVNPVEIYLTEAEEISLKESLKNLNKMNREFAIVNIVEIIETANKRKDINWRRLNEEE